MPLAQLINQSHKRAACSAGSARGAGTRSVRPPQSSGRDGLWVAPGGIATASAATARTYSCVQCHGRRSAASAVVVSCSAAAAFSWPRPVSSALAAASRSQKPPKKAAYSEAHCSLRCQREQRSQRMARLSCCACKKLAQPACVSSVAKFSEAPPPPPRHCCIVRCGHGRCTIRNATTAPAPP